MEQTVTQQMIDELEEYVKIFGFRLHCYTILLQEIEKQKNKLNISEEDFNKAYFNLSNGMPLSAGKNVKNIIKEATKHFKEEWFSVCSTDNSKIKCNLILEKSTKQKIDVKKKLQIEFGNALITFSRAIHILSRIKENTTNIKIATLESLINQYDIIDITKDNETYYEKIIKINDASLAIENNINHIRMDLYYYLSCIKGTITNNNNEDIKKKHLYYMFKANGTNKLPKNTYQFRSCSKYLYQTLLNEKLNLSSPSTFNDPFDCPIRKIFDDATIDKSIKISCFVSKYKLPYYETNLINNLKHVIDEILDNYLGKQKNSDRCQDGKLEEYFNKDQKTYIPKYELFENKEKPNNGKEEYLNTLMWAHYADSHKGICIKYRFSKSIFKNNTVDKFLYFDDVTYSDEDFASINKDNYNYKNGVFLKNKAWEYENELRLLYYDKNGKGDYVSIDAPYCIEAIYFGVKCSKEDKETIYRIMKDKKYIIENQNGIPIKKDIHFYEMKEDEKNFGQIKAVDYNPD